MLFGFVGAVNSLGVVLGQEMERFNRLLHHMTDSLQDLCKALKVCIPSSYHQLAFFDSFCLRCACACTTLPEYLQQVALTALASIVVN